MTDAIPPRLPIPCSGAAGLLSEGPRWDGEREELLWVDIIGSWLHRARLDSRGMLEQIASVKFDRYVGAVAPAVRGGYVLAADAGFLHLDLATLFITTASHGLEESDAARQPDAGRLFRVDGLGVDGEPCLPYRGEIVPAAASR